MNVAGLSAGSGAMAMSHASPMAGGKWDSQYQGAMASVANMLGSSTAALQSSSQSLSQIAGGQGVSQSQLESAIKAGLQSSGSQLTGTRLDNIAHRIAARHPGHHHRTQPSDGPTSPSGSTASNASNASDWSATASTHGVSL